MKVEPPVNEFHSAPTTIDLTGADQSLDEQLNFEQVNAGHVVVYTDGASRNNQFAELRRAGYGAYWSERNPRNFARRLTGQHQTNQRAELAALLDAVQSDARNLEIRSDSQYVVNGFNKHMDRWRQSGWCNGSRPVSNVDIWQELDTALHQRSDGSVRVVKVKGHASWEDVSTGKVTFADKCGNDKADELAVLGAALHGVP
eukprot:7282465-Karenia_brevis.AAC.1